MSDTTTPYEFSFYEHLRGEIFHVGAADETIELMVEKVTPSASRDGKVPFSVIFQSNSAQVMPQDTYRLAGKSAGIVELFIVPVAQKPEGIVYQAVFN